MARPERYEDTTTMRRSISAKTREEIYNRFNGKCADCGKKGNARWQIWKPAVKHFTLNGTHEIHHEIPIDSGGSNDPENLVLLCIECHRKRHKRMRVS